MQPKITSGLEQLVDNLRKLDEQLTSLKATTRRIASLERARDAAHDPSIKAVWDDKAAQLRVSKFEEGVRHLIAIRQDKIRKDKGHA